MKRYLPDYLGRFNLLQDAINLLKALWAGDLEGHIIRLPRFELDGVREEHGYTGDFWNMGDVMRTLRAYHIQVIGYGYTENDTWIRVPQRQARWAEYLLIRAGAPVIMSTVDGRNVAWASNPAHGGRMPTRWDDRPKQDRRAASRARRRSAKQHQRKAAR